MKEIHNKFYSFAFLDSLFFTQNLWHQHGVLVHTLRVMYYVIKNKKWKFLPAAIMHDFGKPFTAFKKDEEDYKFNEWSFTDHEERSFEIIKNWSFVGEYTKKLVRYHYLIRDIKKSKTEKYDRYLEKKAIWDSLDEKTQKDLQTFLVYDDMGKGKKRR